MSQIVGIRWDRNDATKTVAFLVSSDSNNVIFINDCNDEPWESAVSHRQAIRCLENGAAITDPSYNPDTAYWEFRMGRFAAGQDIIVDVAVNADKTSVVVTKVCEQQD